MTKTILLAGAAALALSGNAFAAKAAHPVMAGKSANFHITFPAKHPPGTIYSQRDNDNGIGIVSQNFEPTFDAYDAQGADDFVCQHKCVIKEVIADGAYFNGSGPADSWNVTVYKDNGGTPGNVVGTCTSSHYTDLGFGTPDIKLKNSCNGASKIKVQAGTYWVSVQANMAFGTGGEWGWNTNNTVRGNASQWQNPGNGFSTGCTTYTTTTVCIPSGEGGDNSFALLGKGS